MTGVPEEVFPRPYGRYELLERIGEGGMAEVFRARLPGVGGFEKILVIKRILPHLARNQKFVQMFVNEAQLAAMIQHQNVVQVYELGQLDSGELYIAMEFVDGIDLREVLRYAAQRSLRIPPWFSVYVVGEVLGGLSHAHDLLDAEGQPITIVHRDVTPSNVFISRNGAVKLADFGIAKAAGQMESDTRAGQLKGKISYMPPEQLNGHPLDGRADVFAAGVVLWECLTQRRLFGGRPDFETMLAICESNRDPPSRYNPKLPEELDALTLEALEPDRDRRIASATEFQARLLDVRTKLRPRLLPGEIRHVLEVIAGERQPDPRNGADLPYEGTSEVRDARVVEGHPVIARVHDSTLTPLTAIENIEPPEAADKATPHIELMAASEPIWNQSAVQGRESTTGGLYLLDRSEQTRGPMDGQSLVDLCDPRSGQAFDGVATEPDAWMSLQEFGRLAGLDYLSPDAAGLKNVVMVGKLEQRSLVRVLSRLARAHRTGRFVVMQAGAGRDIARREIDIVKGAPTYVYTDRRQLQLPAQLIEKGLIKEDALTELFGDVIQERISLEAALARRGIHNAARYRAIFMRDRIAELFRWRQGKFAFDASESSRSSQPFAPSLLSVLVDAILRTMSATELEERLDATRNTRLEPAERFEDVLLQLELSKAQEQVARSLAEGRTLSQLLRKLPEERGNLLAVAYVLTEMDVLVGPPRR